MVILRDADFAVPMMISRTKIVLYGMILCAKTEGSFSILL